MSIRSIIRAEYWLQVINDKDSYQKRLEDLRELVEKELDFILENGKILELNNKEYEIT